MKKEVTKFVYACLTFQKSKFEHQKSSCMIQPLSIPECKWNIIFMDFVISFPKTTKGRDSIWVIIDSLTKSAYFVSINIGYPLQKLAELCIKKVISLHGIPLSIVSDRGLTFMSWF